MQSEMRAGALHRPLGMHMSPSQVLILSTHVPAMRMRRDALGQRITSKTATETGCRLFRPAQGDVIEVMTNGHFKATKYRVVPRNGERAAMEFSARLDPDAIVRPHELFLSVSD